MSGRRKSGGIAVISLDLSATAICPRTNRVSEPKACTGCSGDRPARAAERPAQCLAPGLRRGRLDGNHALQTLRQILDQPLHHLLEVFRIERVKEVGKGVMARYPVLKPQKTAQERLLRPPEQRHVATTLAAAQRRQQPNHQHLNQIVARRVAPARVLNTFKNRRKLFHGDDPSTTANTVL